VENCLSAGRIERTEAISGEEKRKGKTFAAREWREHKKFPEGREEGGGRALSVVEGGEKREGLVTRRRKGGVCGARI